MFLMIPCKCACNCITRLCSSSSSQFSHCCQSLAVVLEPWRFCFVCPALMIPCKCVRLCMYRFKLKFTVFALLPVNCGPETMEILLCVSCAACNQLQPKDTARHLTDGRWVCDNQWLGVKGCRGDLWHKDFPGRKWEDWTYEEHVSMSQQKQAPKENSKL